MPLPTEPKVKPCDCGTIPYRQPGRQDVLRLEEVFVYREESECVLAIEDFVCLFMHALRGLQYLQAFSNHPVVGGLEVDNMVEN